MDEARVKALLQECVDISPTIDRDGEGLIKIAKWFTRVTIVCDTVATYHSSIKQAIPPFEVPELATKFLQVQIDLVAFALSQAASADNLGGQCGYLESVGFLVGAISGRLISGAEAITAS